MEANLAAGFVSIHSLEKVICLVYITRMNSRPLQGFTGCWGGGRIAKLIGSKQQSRSMQSNERESGRAVMQPCGYITVMEDGAF